MRAMNSSAGEAGVVAVMVCWGLGPATTITALLGLVLVPPARLKLVLEVAVEVRVVPMGLYWFKPAITDTSS